MFEGSPISWKSKNQVTISLSSVEAEYRSMCRVTSELAWISRLYEELEVPNITPIPLKCDNMVAIYIASNPVYHERTKHIEIDCHFVREKVQSCLISLPHVSTNDQKADILTKSLPGQKHIDTTSKLGFTQRDPSLRGLLAKLI